MAARNTRLTAFIILSTCIIFKYASCQNCVDGVEKVDIDERGFRSPVVLRAKVTRTTRENQTAEVTFLFPTKSAGLEVGDTIIFGPVKRAKGCPRMKKGKEYILFLEDRQEPGTNYFRIKFDPETKMKLTKKLKKVLCKGCVKAPKFKQSDKTVEVEEDRSFTFTCKVSGNPKPVAEFLKDSKAIPKKAKGIKMKIKKKGGGGRLKIRKVQSSHAGVYTCRARNFAGNASLSYTLTVKGDNNTTTTTTTTTATTTTLDACISCKEAGRNFCFNRGRCCYHPEQDEMYCRCQPLFEGRRCRHKSFPKISPGKRNAVEARYHRQTVAIMGVCIALLLVILVCYIVYCKFKKSRSHILKDIQKQYCPVKGRGPENEDERPITTARPEGIVADDAQDNGAQLTRYDSTNLTESPSYAPLAFSQRPQTYDDVIPMQSESKALLPRQQAAYVQREEAKQPNSGRSRINGIAVDHKGVRKPSNVGSDGENSGKYPRRIDELKRNRDSMISTTSSVGSHPELRRPAIPLDDRVAAMSGVHIPPAYGDIPDSGQAQPSFGARSDTDAPRSSHYPDSDDPKNSPQTHRNQDRAPSSPSCTSRLTEADSETRGPGSWGGVRPSARSSSVTSSSDYLPKNDHRQTDSGDASPRSKLSYNEPTHASPPYPYYEQSPHSPRQYHPNSPGMGMPYHQAPVTVASARTHHLPLLTNERTDPGAGLEKRSFLGSPSSSSSDLSSEAAPNRNSHKIEV